MKNFGYTKEVETSFVKTLENLEVALKEEGFGALFKINMQAKLKEKLDKDIEEYMIVGACNPGLAAEALDAEYEIGLLLPCNIIVYSKNNVVFVSSIMPTTAMNMIYNNDIKSLAKKAEKKLKRVIDNL